MSGTPRVLSVTSFVKPEPSAVVVTGDGNDDMEIEVLAADYQLATALVKSTSNFPDEPPGDPDEVELTLDEQEGTFSGSFTHPMAPDTGPIAASFVAVWRGKQADPMDPITWDMPEVQTIYVCQEKTYT